MLLRIAAAAFGAALALAPSLSRADQVVVFAAASTTDAVTEIARLFTARTGHTVRPSFASSSTLAKQVEQGAPANVFISANEKWADYLERKKLLVPGTRSSGIGNAMVLVAPSDAKTPDLRIEKGFDLVAALKGGRLAMGDPDHVPVGIYGKQALSGLGVWEVLEPRLARTNDVRSALALVERGEAAFGIVYATDAAITKGVKVVGTFPASSHEPITYPFAMVADHDTPAARAFLDMLKSPEGRNVFRTFGFALN